MAISEARRAYLRDYQLKWMTARRQRGIILLGSRCYRCDATEDLQFDHIDPATKHPALKSITGSFWSWSWDRIEAELAKCQLLCRSCHQEKTRVDFEPPHGTNSRYTGRRCRCGDCKFAHAQINAKYRKGALAQLVERRHGMAKVAGSIPAGSTIGTPVMSTLRKSTGPQNPGTVRLRTGTDMAMPASPSHTVA